MKKKKVLVAMSGGVDSSVAALLLKKKGYEVYGFFMNASPSGKTIWPSSIEWKEEEKMVRKICEIIGVKKLFIVDCERGYENKIIKPMFKDYARGLTPNPDILCNNIGKFPGLLKKAKEIGADFIATGHYARVRRKTVNNKNYNANHTPGPRGYGFNLLMARDRKKDQSYFLVGLNQKILSKCLFPVGELTKEEVRKIARRVGLPNWDKHGSRGICYLGKIDMKEFLHERIKEKKGVIKSPGGKIIGEHPGIMFFTIGERIGEGKGTRMDNRVRNKFGGKWFVAEKKGNVLVVAPEGHEILKRKKVFLRGMKFINGAEEGRMKARIRHLGELYGGKLVREGRPAARKLSQKSRPVLRGASVVKPGGGGLDKGEGRWIFEFDKGVEGVADGQWIVLYKGERVIGGGEIRLK